jgi:hypothetical protein
MKSISSLTPVNGVYYDQFLLIGNFNILYLEQAYIYDS